MRKTFLKLSRGVLQKLNAFMVCCNSLFSAKLYFVIVYAVQGKEKLRHVVMSKT